MPKAVRWNVGLGMNTTYEEMETTQMPNTKISKIMVTKLKPVNKLQTRTSNHQNLSQ